MSSAAKADDTGMNYNSRIFITKKFDDVRRLEGRKLVDEVADFFHKVSLEQGDDICQDDNRDLSLSKHEYGREDVVDGTRGVEVLDKARAGFGDGVGPGWTIKLV